MEEKFVKLNANDNWSDYTFIFPCVSVGNIGQLTVDLLISSLSHTQKAGYLISSLVQPLVGHDAYVQKSTNLSLSCDLYENKSAKLIILQQRAPLFAGKRNQFIELLADFIKKENFAQVISLASSHAYERLDSQLVGMQCRFLTTQSDIQESLEKSLSWKLLEKRIDHNHNLSSDSNNDLEYFIPGGGIAQKFFKFSKEKNLNVTILMIFAHEGNNIPESIQLANYLNDWKNFVPKTAASWRIPVSWQYLFGHSMDPNVQSQIF